MIPPAGRSPLTVWTLPIWMTWRCGSTGEICPWSFRIPTGLWIRDNGLAILWRSRWRISGSGCPKQRWIRESTSCLHWWDWILPTGNGCPMSFPADRDRDLWLHVQSRPIPHLSYVMRRFRHWMFPFRHRWSICWRNCSRSWDWPICLLRMISR